MSCTRKTKEAIPFHRALVFWFKLGFISFGGPAGQISIMHEELVNRRKWISDNRFLHALNYTMLLPGPEAQQLATYTGWLMHGLRGGMAAGILFILPSFIMLSLLAWLYLIYGNITSVQGIIYGIKPAVTAIVLFAAVRIGKKTLVTPVHWILAIAAFIAISIANVPFPWVVLAAGLSGLVLHRVRPSLFRPRDNAHSKPGQVTDTIIGDDDPPLPHTRFSWRNTIAISITGITLWTALMGLLVYSGGWEGTLAQMGWFFTKAAMVTFGGAYAVLPYVYQGGVETYGWLSGPQMIDGLALGETTPGPLIMIVAFVGFVGGFGAELSTITTPAQYAWLAASTATMFTFLPSFIFILVGGPAVESTRGNLGLAAPLGAITAAVVGVIVSLAVFFGIHVFWQEQSGSGLDWAALSISVAAFLALWRLNTGIIPVIILSAIAGVIVQFAIRSF